MKFCRKNCGFLSFKAIAKKEIKFDMVVLGKQMLYDYCLLHRKALTIVSPVGEEGIKFKKLEECLKP